MYLSYEEESGRSMKKKKLADRVDYFAAKAYLVLMLVSQGESDRVNQLVDDMQAEIEDDKKLAQHLWPTLEEVCKERGLVLSTSRVKSKETH